MTQRGMIGDAEGIKLIQVFVFPSAAFMRGRLKQQCCGEGGYYCVLFKMVKEISNSCVILRYLQLFEENKKFIEIGGINK